MTQLKDNSSYYVQMRVKHVQELETKCMITVLLPKDRRINIGDHYRIINNYNLKKKGFEQDLAVSAHYTFRQSCGDYHGCG